MLNCKIVNGYGMSVGEIGNEYLYNVYECGRHYKYDMHSEDVIDEIFEKHNTDHMGLLL